MGPKVHMFVLNNFTRDTRVLREARALASAGYEVTVFAELGTGTPAREVIGDISVIRFRNDGVLDYVERYLETPASRAVRWVERHVRRSRSMGTSSNLQARTSPKGASDSTVAYGEAEEKVHFIRRLYRRLRARVFHRAMLRRAARFFRTYRSHIHGRGASVYHAHDLPMLHGACCAAQAGGGLVVYDSHELFTEVGHASADARQLWVDQEREFIGRADAILTVCPSIGEELRSRYGVAAPTILRNCCEPMPPTDRRDRLRQATGINSDTPIVLYQGGFIEGRGLDHFIRAAHFIERAALVLMGWGNIEDVLKRLVRDEKLEDRVYFLPPAAPQELLAWTSGADIGVIPYQAVRLNNYYSCPNKLFEYINAGVPVAASAFPELQRIVDTYGVGRTFDPESSESIGRTIHAMLEDEVGLSKMKQAARKAAQTLNWDVESRKLVSVYNDLLAREP